MARVGSKRRVVDSSDSENDGDDEQATEASACSAAVKIDNDASTDVMDFDEAELTGDDATFTAMASDSDDDELEYRARRPQRKRQRLAWIDEDEDTLIDEAIPTVQLNDKEVIELSSDDETLVSHAQHKARDANDEDQFSETEDDDEELEGIIEDEDDENDGNECDESDDDSMEVDDERPTEVQTLDEGVIYLDDKSNEQIELQRRARRLLKRANKRRTDETSYTAQCLQREETKLANLVHVEAFISSENDNLSKLRGTREHMIEACLENQITKLQAIQQFYTFSRDLRRLPPLADDDPTWIHFNTPVTELAFDILRDPFGWKSQRHEKAGTMRQVTERELRDRKKVNFYIRRGPLLPDDPKNYGSRFPTELPWVLHTSSVAGYDPSTTFSSILENISQAGLEPLASSLQKACKDNVPTASKFPPTAGESLQQLYIGETIANRPLGRHEDDLKLDEGMRMLNWKKVNRALSTVYHITALDFQVAGPRESLINPLVGTIEDIFIVLSHASLNAPTRCIMPSYLPSSEDSTVCDRALSMTKPFDNVIRPMDDARIETGRTLIKLQARHLFRRLGEKKRIAGKALTSIQDNLMDAAATVNNEVVSVTIAKDVTSEAYVGRIGGIWDEDAGPTFQQQRQLHRLINPSIPATGNVPLPVVRTNMGAMVSLYPVSLSHCNVPLTKAYLSRNLCYLSPILITTASWQVLSVIDDDGLATAWPGDVASFQQFVDGQCPTTDLDRYFPDIDERQDHITRLHRGSAYLDSVGNPKIVRIGPREQDLVILIPTRHNGANRHDPILDLPRLRVQYLVQVLVTIVQKCIAQALQNAPPPLADPHQRRIFLSAIIEQVKTISLESGHQDCLDGAKSWLRSCEIAVASLRSKNRQLRGSIQERPYVPHERQHRPKPVVYKSDETAASAAKNRAELGKRSHEAAVERARVKEDGTSFKSELERTNIRPTALHAIADMLSWLKLGDPPFPIPALEDYGQNKTPQLRHARPWGETDGKWALRELWRMFNCSICGSWPLSMNTTTNHLCLEGKVIKMDEGSLLYDDSLTVLLYPHCIFNHPDLSTIVEQKPEELGFVSYSAHSILSENRESLPESVDISVVDTSINVYLPKNIKPDSQKGKDALFTYAVDILLQAVCPPCPNPKEKTYAFGESNEKLCNAFIDNQDLFMASCSNGYFSFINNNRASKHKCGDKTERATCPVAEVTGIANIFKLPVNSARRVWFGEMVQGVWSGTLKWTKEVKVKKKKRGRKPKGG